MKPIPPKPDPKLKGIRGYPSVEAYEKAQREDKVILYVSLVWIFAAAVMILMSEGVLV